MSRPALILLCGGASSRMGRDKASLTWGATTLLEHLVARLAPMCCETLVVAAPEQAVPRIPNRATTLGNVRILHDPVAHTGPLAGAIQGLRVAKVGNRPTAFLVGCDAPFVEPKIVELLAARLGDHQAAVVEHDGVLQPLLALVRTDVVDTLEAAWSSGERSLRRCLETLDVVRVPSEDLRTFDPGLRSLINLNTPEAYRLHQPKNSQNVSNTKANHL
ncbi:MAG: molybdenum cofactor guanylyltransferase [Pirellulales bacterium]